MKQNSDDVIFDTDELTEDIIDNSSKDQFNYMMREKSIENLNLVLQTLTAREERILRLYYIEDMNDTEIAKLFSLCRQRIYDIRQRSLCKLRHSSRSDLLKDFLKVA
jgi:RNA polymerase sigma factor (sigma-70 family)